VFSVIGLPSLLADDGVHQLCTALPGPIIAYLTGNVRQAAPRERTVSACDETLLGEVDQQRYPANSTSNACASWRSAVSKPSVNQP
jgi:hypothetical protein